MKRSCACLPVVGILAVPLCGCDALLGLLGPTTVTVRFVNNGDFAVEATLTYDDQQDLPEAILLETGTQQNFTVPAGDSVTVSRNCDDFQVMVLEDADLLVIGGVGPETSSDVLRDGDEFSCGDTIVLTFDHTALLVDFDVTVSVQ